MTIAKKSLKAPKLSVEDGDIEVQVDAGAAPQAKASKPTMTAKELQRAKLNHIPLDMSREEMVKNNIMTERQAHDGVFKPVRFDSVDRSLLTVKVLTEKGWVLPLPKEAKK